MAKAIEQEYADARPKSKALYERAVKMMPSGAAHDGRVFSPFPFYVAPMAPTSGTSTAIAISMGGAATAR